MKTIPLNLWRKSPGMAEEELRTLAERYMEGDTTNTEEERLRQHFTAKDAAIPADLRYLKALFTYEAANQSGHRDGNQSRTTLRRRHVATWMAVAASVALLVAIALPRLQAGGDYAIIDGHRCASREVVRQEAEAMLDMVSYSEDSFNALDLMTSPDNMSD